MSARRAVATDVIPAVEESEVTRMLVERYRGLPADHPPPRSGAVVAAAELDEFMAEVRAVIDEWGG